MNSPFQQVVPVQQTHANVILAGYGDDSVGVGGSYGAVNINIYHYTLLSIVRSNIKILSKCMGMCSDVFVFPLYVKQRHSLVNQMCVLYCDCLWDMMLCLC